jgi:S1-C subfamily serine protease
MNELITHGAVRRGTISGIELYPVTARIAEEFRAPNTKGVIVADVIERSDAYAAGIRQYDIIVSFNGVTIEDPTHFMRMLADAPIGGTVNLGLLRNGRSLSAKVPIVQTPGARTRRR